MIGALNCTAAPVTILGSILVCRPALKNHSYTADPLSLAGCLALWCPGVVFGRNKQRFRHLQSQGTPLPDGGTWVNADCAIYCFLTPIRQSWILQVCLLGNWPSVESLKVNLSDR